MVKEKGCTFGLVLQQKVNNMNENIKTGFKKIEDNQTELFNHQSSRIPQETMREIKTQYKIITILVGLLCTCVGVGSTFIISILKSGGV